MTTTEVEMVDILFAVGQFLCVVGLLYGLVLTVAHRDCVDDLRAHYDPVAGHDWLEIRTIARVADARSRLSGRHAAGFRSGGADSTLQS
jgi:hypothetical protein